jgi:Tol biopolymer transport system component
MSCVTRFRFALVLAFVAPLALAEPLTLRVQDPQFQPNSASGLPAVSANGKVVAFTSGANNLVADPTTGGLFIYDLVADRIDALMPYGNAFSPSISADGRYIAFVTSSDDLAPGIDSQYNDILRVDRQDGSFARVTRAFGGLPANYPSESPAISGDGRWVAFASTASNLVAPSTTPGRRHIYLADMSNGFVELLSRSGGFVEGDRDSLAMEPNAMSSDGTRLVFASGAENIAPVFAGNVSDVIVMTRDLQTGAVSYQNVNRSVAGEVGTLSSDRGSISPNGRFVVFRTAAANILAGRPGDSDLFVRDLDANTLRAVRLPAGFDACSRARVSNLGDVLMQCAPGAPATALQVFLAPADGGAPRLLSVDWIDREAGQGSAGQSFTFSADGTLVALESQSNDHIPDDTNLAADVFLVAEPEVFDRLFSDGFE